MFYKKLLGTAFAVSLIGVLFMPRVGRAILSTSELQAQINELMRQLQSLQDQINGLNSPVGSPLIYGRTLNGTGGANSPDASNKRTNPSFYNNTNANGTATFCHDFNVDLTVGSAGAEVTALRDALVREGISSSSGVGGAPSDVFDESVAAAVVQFQAKYGIRQTGYVGPLTRGRLNQIYGCGNNTEKPSITVLSPNGGEVWDPILSQYISWTVKPAGSTAPVDIYIHGIVSGNTFLINQNVASFAGADKSYMTWSPANSPALAIDKSFVIKICLSGTAICDESNTPFTITASSGNGQLLNTTGLGSGKNTLDSDNANSSDNKRTNPSFYNTTNATGTAAYSLTINPSSLSFTVFSNALESPSPAGWQLTLTNHPDTGVTVTKTYTGQLATGSDWLSVGALTGSGATKTIMVTPQPWKVPGGLSNGIYTASITITANGQTVTVPVALTVSAPPTQQGTLSFSQSSFNFNYVQGGTLPALQTSTFTNTSNANVYYRISVPSQPTWLNASYAISLLTATPGNPSMIGASVDPSGLNPGTYTTNIVITGNFIGSPVTIPVTLTVTPASVATVQPYFTQNGVQTTSLTCGVPEVFNVPGYSQVWLVQYKGIVQTPIGIYNVPSAPYSPNCATDIGTYINAAYTVVNGGQGQYIGEVRATISGQPNVTFSVSPTSLAFSSQGGTVTPTSQQLTLTNFPDSGGQISTGVTGPISWLASSLSGSGTTKTITVSVSNTLNLQAGTYTGAITLITSSQTIIVPVTLTVTPPIVTQVTPYFTQNGVQTTSLTCGVPEVFNVPGYSQVWLTQTKTAPNGAVSNSFNNTYTVPSAPYSPDCTRDLGSYKNDVYTVVNGGQGQFIGTVTATIGAAATAQSGVTPVPSAPLKSTSAGSDSAVASRENDILSQQASVLAAMASLLEKLGSLLLGR